MDIKNSLWSVGKFDRTDNAANFRAEGKSSPYEISIDDFLQQLYFRLDLNTKLLTSDTVTGSDPYRWYPYYNGTPHNPYSEPYQNLTAQYCLSEPIIIPCKLEVENSLLAIVCLVCIIKCSLCIATLVKLRNYTPLATPGDAIESFILHPDATTKGMCSFSRRDFVAQERAKNGSHAIPRG